MANVASFFQTPADVTSRNAEYSGTPLSDTAGDGSYNSYLGCNRAGSNAPGIGIATDNGALNPNDWTLEDQDGSSRNPQDSQFIGGAGFVDRSSTDWPSSGGASGKGTVPINAFDVADLNDTFSVTDANTGWVQNEVA